VHNLNEIIDNKSRQFKFWRMQIQAESLLVMELGRKIVIIDMWLTIKTRVYTIL